MLFPITSVNILDICVDRLNQNFIDLHKQQFNFIKGIEELYSHIALTERIRLESFFYIYTQSKNLQFHKNIVTKTILLGA